MVSRGLYLQWEGKKLYRQRIPTPRMLEAVPELSFGSDVGNMIIEGDNLQVLASLKSRYAGQVDVVYIDPPYNRGLDDFRYSDKRYFDPDADDSDARYISNVDGGRHTKWLNFMAPRIYMLREMLHDERGVILISINDIELFRLGILMTEIFGEDNLVGTLVWKGSNDNNPTRIAVDHEYVLCYAKDKSRLPSVWKGKESETKTELLDLYEELRAQLTSIEEIEKEFRAYLKVNKDRLDRLTHYNRIDAEGPYTGSRSVHNPGKDGYFYEVIDPGTGKPCKTPVHGYRFPWETMKQDLIDAGRLIYPSDQKSAGTKDQIVQIKKYLRDFEGSLRSVINIDSRSGANTLANLFDGNRNLFRNPKPVELLQLLLDYTTTRQSVVLDAFAGSGTTGQAVLALNQADGGERRFIMVEEGKTGDRFARTLTAERMCRAIDRNGYKDGFVFYRTGRKIDRRAIVELERDGLASLICQADETGRGVGITRVSGYTYIIGRNPRGQAICLVWNGEDDSEVTKHHFREAAMEVTAAGLKRPFRMYGTHTLVADTTSWKFCQIPDEILTQMHIQEDLEDLLEEEA